MVTSQTDGRPIAGPRGALRVSLAASTVVLAGIVAVAGVGAMPSAERAPGRYYLALGDSMAYGFQPTKPPAAGPKAFDTGYVDVFAARLRKLSPGIKVVNYGCPGESTTTFAHGGCPWLKSGMKLHHAFRGSQLQAALAFLRANPSEVSPITLTLWGNDLAPLSQKGARAPKAIASFAARLDTILRKLRAAAPDAEIIVTGAWNPEVTALRETDPLYRSLDAAIARVAATSRAHVADMYAAFTPAGKAAVRKARLCRLTFCAKGDPHPTNAGYRAMAAAFLKVSGYPRK